MAVLGKTWRVSYGSVSIPCKTVTDAKLLAQELVKKGHQVRAETAGRQSSMRGIGPNPIFAWMAE
jgi:hypothetical protein